MADMINPGFESGLGGHYAPGYATTLAERLQKYVGKNITVYVGEEMTEASGMLHYVGANYVEIHRKGTDGRMEAILIPMQHIMAVAAPMDGMPHHP